MVDVRDWFLTRPQRGNPLTRLYSLHPGDEAWTPGNLVRPLVHGSTYFAELKERIDATREGDLVFFTDWQGDADERLTDEPGSEVVEVLGSADERGVDVRGLVWRSHQEAFGFSGRENRRLGRELQKRGAEALLDMRIRMGGSHHQKLLVIRHRDDPTRDVAYVGGIDLCYSRRDDAEHLGDPQALDNMAEEYGPTPPWHDVQLAIQGPAVADVETVFRERWEDPTPLTRSPLYWTQDKLLRMDMHPDPLPEQAPPPPKAGSHTVQLLRTYPNLRYKRDYPFARGGERTVARGYTKALARARQLVYLEDQYLWGHHVGTTFTRALQDNPELRVVAVVPLCPDLGTGLLGRTPQLYGRMRAMRDMAKAAPDRVAIYGIENHEGTPVYVHAKVCAIDDTWVTVGSDNFNRRSWTHDSELTAATIDEEEALARDLRLTLAAEHLDLPPAEADHLADPVAMFDAYAESAAALDAWHSSGQAGPRPPGRLRRLTPPKVGLLARLVAAPAYRILHDPDGRPGPLRKRDAF